MKITISFWVPAILCALISVAVLAGLAPQKPHWWQVAFYAFLPMCFFLAGSIMFRMHREIARLRHRLARLERHQQVEERPGGSSRGQPAA
jgi:hypothetical protein